MNKAGYTLIIGLGQTGLSCARYLKKQGVLFAVTDTRPTPPGLEELAKFAPETPTCFGEVSEALIQEANQLIVSPGVSLKIPAIAQALSQGKSVIGDIELFARQVKASVVGITGANGKSTVTTLVGEMAKKAGVKTVVAGNIGTPILEVEAEQAELFVLELSSFQLETTYSLKLQAATILNISEDHMDRYATMQEYIDAKQRIYQHAKVAVYNRDYSATLPTKPFTNYRSFAVDAPQSNYEYGIIIHQGKRYLARGKELLIAEAELSLQGYHNVLNALASLALGEAIGLPLTAMLNVLKSFKGLRHRCELVECYQGISWYNDSKATNVGAAIAAIKSLATPNKKDILLIAGGLGKGADFLPLRPVVEQQVKLLILLGKDRDKIKAACGPNVLSVEVDSLATAIAVAEKYAQAEDKVLLSPACASFDMFKDFNDRGETFVKLVRQRINDNKAVVA